MHEIKWKINAKVGCRKQAGGIKQQVEKNKGVIGLSKPNRVGWVCGSVLLMKWVWVMGSI